MKRFLLLISLSILLSACHHDPNSFVPGDMKAEFCGAYINYQYCECAFGNNLCNEVAMDKGQAGDYVEKEYEKWVEQSRMRFAYACTQANGYMKEEKCVYCDEDELVKDGRCIDKEDSGIDPAAQAKCEADCAAYCQNNTLVSQACKADLSGCERVSERDCSLDLENFGGLSFPMLCRENACVRDDATIAIRRNDLDQELVALRAQGQVADPFKDLFSRASIASGKYCRGEEEALDLPAFLGLVASSSDAGLAALGSLSDFVAANADKGADYDKAAFKEIACKLSDHYAANTEKVLGGDDETTKRIKEIQGLLDVLPNALP